MKKIAVVACSLALAAVLQAPLAQLAHAETTATATTTATVDISSLLATIKSLMAKVADLQSQLGSVKQDIRAAITTDLKAGMTSDQIKQIQELLATDQSIYPEGITSGYFGKLTEKALMRFQAKHGLTQTGEVDQDTKDLLNEYLAQRFGTTTVPQGLLTAPGILKKVHDNICGEKGHGGGAWGLFCKNEQKGGGDEDSGSDQGHHGKHWSSATSTSNQNAQVSISIEDRATTTISFTYNGTTYHATSSSISQSSVLAAVADELNVSVSNLNTALVSKIKTTLATAIAKYDASAEISVASAKITSVQADITAATTSTTTAAAQTKLNVAKTQLHDAQSAYAAGHYSFAETLAIEAKATAQAADDML